MFGRTFFDALHVCRVTGTVSFWIALLGEESEEATFSFSAKIIHGGVRRVNFHGNVVSLRRNLREEGNNGMRRERALTLDGRLVDWGADQLVVRVVISKNE